MIGKLPHDLQGFSTIPGGLYSRISEPSTVCAMFSLQKHPKDADDSGFPSALAPQDFNREVIKTHDRDISLRYWLVDGDPDFMTSEIIPYNNWEMDVDNGKLMVFRSHHKAGYF